MIANLIDMEQRCPVGAAFEKIRVDFANTPAIRDAFFPTVQPSSIEPTNFRRAAPLMQTKVLAILPEKIGNGKCK